MRAVVFFFKQKTAYEVRISDWSSDVCSAEASAGFSAASASKTVVRARSRRKWPAERLHLPKIPTLMRLPPAKCRAELRHLGWPVASARCPEFRRTALSLKSDEIGRAHV